jgi:hypothetical protein
MVRHSVLQERVNQMYKINPMSPLKVVVSKENGDLTFSVVGDNVRDHSLKENPDHWHNRAEEARTIAEVMANEDTKLHMYRIAQAYDQIAIHALEMRKQKRLMQEASRKERKLKIVSIRGCK